ncbi:hypothetical protein OC846_006715, partial [Tilletia horrida]
TCTPISYKAPADGYRSTSSGRRKGEVEEAEPRLKSGNERMQRTPLGSARRRKMRKRGGTERKMTNPPEKTNSTKSKRTRKSASGSRLSRLRRSARSRIGGVSCGARSNMAISSRGKLYAWGTGPSC